MIGTTTTPTAAAVPPPPCKRSDWRDNGDTLWLRWNRIAVSLLLGGVVLDHILVCVSEYRTIGIGTHWVCSTPASCLYLERAVTMGGLLGIGRLLRLAPHPIYIYSVLYIIYANSNPVPVSSRARQSATIVPTHVSELTAARHSRRQSSSHTVLPSAKPPHVTCAREHTHSLSRCTAATGSSSIGLPLYVRAFTTSTTVP
jgi:hypothetical protein